MAYTTIDDPSAFFQTILYEGGTADAKTFSGNSDGNGYGNFNQAVPSGYYALNTKNLAEFG